MHGSEELTLGGQYKVNINHRLGKGAFGEIFIVNNIKTNEELAVKREMSRIKNPQLCYESKILKYLQGGIGIPNIHYFISDDEYNYMVLDLLGKSIEEVFSNCDKIFSLKTTIMLTEQMLSRLEYIHSKCIIHRDVKPDNFLMGIGKKKHIVYAVDFGLAKRYKDLKTGEHIPYKDGKSLTGTARYASIYTHLGMEQSRRDDLESLGYVLLYLLKGELPWQGVKAKNKKDKYQKISEKKIYTSLDQLCKGYPSEFVSFFQYCRSLQFEEKPDYSYLKSLLKAVFERYNYEYDFTYDWECKTVNKNHNEDITDDEPLPDIAEEDKPEFVIEKIDKMCLVNRLYNKK